MSLCYVCRLRTFNVMHRWSIGLIVNGALQSSWLWLQILMIGVAFRLMCITSLQSLSQYRASMRCGRSHIDGYGDDKEKNDDDDDDDYDWLWLWLMNYRFRECRSLLLYCYWTWTTLTLSSVLPTCSTSRARLPSSGSTRTWWDLVLVFVHHSPVWAPGL